MWNIGNIFSRLCSQILRSQRNNPAPLHGVPEQFSTGAQHPSPYAGSRPVKTVGLRQLFCLHLLSSLPASWMPVASVFFFFLSKHSNDVGFQEQSKHVIKTISHSCAYFTLSVGFMFLWFPFFCRCSRSGISSWLGAAAGSHPPTQGTGARAAVRPRGSVSLCRHGAPCCLLLPSTATLQQKGLRDHTGPGTGINVISKGEEKQPAGQPELLLTGSLQIILASIS